MTMMIAAIGLRSRPAKNEPMPSIAYAFGSMRAPGNIACSEWPVHAPSAVPMKSDGAKLPPRTPPLIAIT